ncbi:MAG: hypothetical protein ACFFE4_14520 [Candidatus Thorarchaeota archaeon]
MICDVLIIKDGLPLLSKSFSNSSNNKNLFSEIDDLLMVSGFFSALNSFSDSFEDLGTISELKLSNNKLKLSFLKDTNISDLIYLATYDHNTELINVQKILKKISNRFVKEFEIDQILKWNGRLNSFKEFENIVEQFVEEETSQKKKEYDDQISDWIKSFESEKEETISPKTDLDFDDGTPEYYNYIPVFTTSKKINPKHYLTGDISCIVYENIDGVKTINQITEEINVEQNKVYNICKNLIKMGFISFN